MSENRWQLTEEIMAEYMPIIGKFIMDIETNLEDELKIIDLSPSSNIQVPINPYQLWHLLKYMGYEASDWDENGWEHDFWCKFYRDNSPTLEIFVCGMTFELILREYEEI